jgi:hypothetical protein
MKRHLFLLPFLLLPVAGCAGMGDLLAFNDGAPEAAQDAAQTDVTPVAAPPAMGEPAPQWCQRVAAKARGDAAAGGFDAATQDRMAAQSYRQCLAMAGTG